MRDPNVKAAVLAAQQDRIKAAAARPRDPKASADAAALTNLGKMFGVPIDGAALQRLVPPPPRTKSKR